MTVEELIQKLSSYNKDMNVYVIHNETFEEPLITSPLIATQDDDGIVVKEEMAILIL